MSKPIHVLFVCLGNICRSPTAEAVFVKMLEEQKLKDHFVVDSAGTAGHHEGEEADPRTIEHGRLRGYNVTSISRPVEHSVDFEKFDYIVAMDDDNHSDLMELDPDKHYSAKIYKASQFCSVHKIKGVPDPFYGGPEGFNQVIDIIEDVCKGLLGKIKIDNKL